MRKKLFEEQIVNVKYCTGLTEVAQWLKKKKNLPANAGDPASIPRLGRSPGEGNGSPLQYSCQDAPMAKVAWQATVHEAAKSRTQLNTHTPPIAPA